MMNSQERSVSISGSIPPTTGSSARSSKPGFLGRYDTLCVWLPGSDSVVRIPAANFTVRAGFRKYWQEKMNEAYKVIIVVARKIPDKILQEDPKLLMWYDRR